MFSKAIRRTKIIGGLGVFAGGSACLSHMFINDDLDDIQYFATRQFYSKPPAQKKVVVLGSGWGAMSFVQKLDPKEFAVTVVSPRPFFFYTPLLVGTTTGAVSPGSIIEPLRDSAPDVDFLRTACKDVDLENRKVICDDDVTLDYDHLVVSVGAQPNTFGIPGVDKYGRFLKEVEHGRKVRQELLNIVAEAEVAHAAGKIDKVKQLLNFVVVGGGPTGVEFCGELSDYIAQDLKKHYPKIAHHFQVTLVEALPGLLTMFQKKVGQYVQDHLTVQGVDVRLNAMVKEVEPEKVHLKTKDGGIHTMDYGILVWVAGVGMRPFTRALCEKIGKDRGQTDRRGLLLDECLRVKGTVPGEVFAIGDCAISGHAPTAQVAYQQGKYLGRMFRKGRAHLVNDPEAAPFQYNHQGSMAYIGQGEGAAQLDPNSMIKLGRGKVTDHLFWRSLYGDEKEFIAMGAMGFALWRYVYFNKLLSGGTRMGVASDWLRTGFFGRPTASSSQGTLGTLITAA
jgi:NADH:ubiquinone reductase (non-electrogenic)